jgi:hypothetical protein
MIDKLAEEATEDRRNTQADAYERELYMKEARFLIACEIT